MNASFSVSRSRVLAAALACTVVCGTSLATTGQAKADINLDLNVPVNAIFGHGNTLYGNNGNVGIQQSLAMPMNNAYGGGYGGYGGGYGGYPSYPAGGFNYQPYQPYQSISQPQVMVFGP